MSPPAQPLPLTPRRAVVLLHVTVFIWGFTAILGKLISLSAVPLVWYRLAVAAPVLGALALARRDRGPPVPWRLRLQLWLTGGLVALHWVLFYAAVKVAGVGVAVVCLSTITFWVALVEPVVFRRRFVPLEALLGLLVVVGVVLLVRGEAHATPTGLAIGLGSAVASSLFGTINGRFAEVLPPLDVSVHELGAALAWLTLSGLVVPLGLPPPQALSLADVVWLLVLALGCTVLPWLWSLAVLKAVRPFTMALAVNLEPVYSLVLAYLFFPSTERLGATFYAGAALLVGLVALHGVWKSRASATLAGDVR